MAQNGRSNYTRLSLYTRLATSILKGTQNVDEVANLLVDVRFIEIPQAFADAIADVAREPETVHGLEARFSHLVQYVAFVAFGTTERNAIPSWFLQNYECFLAAMMHRLLVLFTAQWHVGRLRVDGAAAVSMQARRAFEMALALTAGTKSYLSLDCLTKSSGAHAVLTVCNHSRYQFLSLAKPMPRMYCLFMDVLAKEILASTDRQDDTDVQTAFGYFASTRLWRTFAQNCMDGTGLEFESIGQLERDVTAASAVTSKKRKASPPPPPSSPGPTDSPSRPSTPTNSPTTPRRAWTASTPPEKRRAVCPFKAASQPFSELYEREGSRLSKRAARTPEH